MYKKGGIYRLGLPERAIEDHDEAIRLDPKYALAYNGRAVAYDRLGQSALANQDFATACKLDTDCCVN